MVIDEPKYVVLEGIDGCGSTTQCELIESSFNNHDIDIVSTKEPTDGEIGKIARKYLKESDPIEEVHALLFAADRLVHDREVNGWLRSGKWVIGDRGLGSSLVYQSITCGMDFTQSVNQKAKTPDLTIVIKIATNTALNRLEKRWAETGQYADRFENNDFLDKIAQEYNLLYKRLPNVKFVNGEQSKEKVFEDCIELLKESFQTSDCISKLVT